MEANKKRLRVLKQVFGDYEYSSREFLFHCPKCKHHKRKLSVSLKKNVFKCWICDYAGRNIDRLIRRYGDIRDQREWLSFKPKIKLSEFDKILAEVNEEEEIHTVELPEEFTTMTSGKRDISFISARNYLKKRGIGKEDILRWKIGFCGEGKFKGRVVIPSFDLNGELNYFISRAYDGSWRKYMNPSIPKSKIIFNELYLDFDSDLVLTEGIFDAIKAGPNAVPILGSTLNERSRLFREIIKNDTPVYICLDSDAKKKELKIIENLLRYDVEVYRIDLGNYEDLAEMEKETFKKRKEEAILMNQERCLLARAGMI